MISRAISMQQARPTIFFWEKILCIPPFRFREQIGWNTGAPATEILLFEKRRHVFVHFPFSFAIFSLRRGRGTVITQDPLERKLPDAVEADRSVRESMRYRYQIIEHSTFRSAEANRFFHVVITEPPVDHQSSDHHYSDRAPVLT